MADTSRKDFLCITFDYLKKNKKKQQQQKKKKKKHTKKQELYLLAMYNKIDKFVIKFDFLEKVNTYILEDTLGFISLD